MIKKVQNIKKNKLICNYFENLCGWCVGDKREEGYCVGRLSPSLTESLLSVASFSFCATLTRKLSSELEWSKAFLSPLLYGKAKYCL